MTGSRHAHWLAPIAAIALAAAAAAQTSVARHAGCADPTTEGWTEIDTGGAVVAEAACGGTAAWRFDDNSVGSSRFYRRSFNDARIGLLESAGWTLRGRVQVIDSGGNNIPFRSTHGLNFRTASVGFDLFLRVEPTDEITVYVVTEYDTGGGADGVAYTFDPSPAAFHTYELVYDPAAGSADLLVDGAEVISDYQGAVLAPIVCCHTAVSWGATTTSGTGEARWGDVELIVDCDLSIADITGEGDVNLTDLATLLATFGLDSGAPGYNAAADLDGSNSIGLSDLALLLRDFGTSCN